jgi:protein tyrosine phosphatase (PTP) superfamily phosphohydrolase (DUF442 family)
MQQLEGILNFVRVDEALATSGQPTREQFALIRAAGYRAVVNLATAGSSNHLPDEPEIVRGLGLGHHAIPVEWSAPRREDFERLSQVLAERRGEATWAHCTMNWRVSAFASL